MNNFYDVSTVCNDVIPTPCLDASLGSRCFVMFCHSATPLQQLQSAPSVRDAKRLKVQDAMLSAVRPPYYDIQHVPAWLYALSLLGLSGSPGPNGSCLADAQHARGAAFIPAQLAGELMDATEDCFRRLVTEIHMVRVCSSCILSHLGAQNVHMEPVMLMSSLSIDLTPFLRI
jgi:hypothetical protein